MVVIKKGQVIEVLHNRKGTMTVMAKEDFDTESMEFWPVVLAEKQMRRGLSIEGLFQGDNVPCKGSLISSFKVVE